MIEELCGKLEEADWLSDEDRAKLTRMLGQFRELCVKMEGNPAISPERAAEIREELRGLWLNMMESCRKLDVAERVLIEKRADQADSQRVVTLAKLRLAHSAETAMEEGTYSGPWEEWERLLEIIGEVEERGESMLEDLTAEDIRQLRDEGVLGDR